MRNIFSFTRRGVLLFLRDRAAVFFSFLSAIILIALYFLFVGKSYAAGVVETVGGLLTNDGVYSLVYIQMIAGVLVLNSLSLSVGVFSTIARDFETRRVDSFLLTPISAASLLTSYFLSGLAVSFALSIITWAASVILIGALFGYWVSAAAIFAVSGILLVASFISCSIMLMFTAAVKSSAAIGVFSGVSGTFLGFICGIYMPYEMLGNGIKVVGSVLPFTHITIWMKQIVLGDACGKLGVSGGLKDAMLSSFSADNVGFVGVNAPQWDMLGYSVLFAAVCLAFAWALIRKRLIRR
jgi:multidrug/hemolysin transport system permease protein